MNPRRLLQALAVAVIFAAAAVGGAPGAPTSTLSTGFDAVTGTAASSFTLPTDVELVQRLELGAFGLTYERYQQRYGPARANVVGGQLTLYRDASGSVRLVLGAHYPSITATNRVSVSAAKYRSCLRVGIAHQARLSNAQGPELPRMADKRLKKRESRRAREARRVFPS